MKDLSTTKDRLSRLSSNIKEDICELLDISELDYCNRQYEEGIRYLENYIPNDTMGQELLLKSRIFWNWWRNHWELRDCAFLKASADKYHSLSKRLTVYAHLNNGEMLTMQIHPGSAILEETYAKMMGKLMDKKHRS